MRLENLQPIPAKTDCPPPPATPGNFVIFDHVPELISGIQDYSATTPGQ